MKRSWVVSFITLVITCYALTMQGQEYKDFRYINIDVNATKVDFFESIESVEFVRLEETDNSLLERVYHYLPVPGGFAIPQKGSKKVFVFSETGEYRSVIDRFGQGPEEHSGFCCYWEEDGGVALFGRMMKVHIYDLEGNHMGTKKLSFKGAGEAQAGYPYQDGYIVTTSGKLQQDFSLDVAGHHVVFFDNKLQIKFVRIPVKEVHPFPFGLSKELIHHGDDIYYKKVLRDSVYKVVGDDLEPFMRFDFGDLWSWNDPNTKYSMSTAFQEKKREDMIYEFEPLFGKEKVFITYYYTLKKYYRGYVDIGSGKFYPFNLRKADREEFKIIPIDWFGDRLLFSVDTYELEEFVQRLGKEKYSIKGNVALDEILQSENPVLAWVTFK